MVAPPTSYLSPTDEGDLFVQAMAYRGTEYRGGEHVVAWAVAALEQGLETPSLAILAGLSPDDEFEIESYLNEAVAELSRTRPDPEQALWEWARWVAHAVTIETHPWDPCLAELNSLFYATDHDRRLVRFLHLSDDLDRIENGESPLFFPNLTRTTAVGILQSEARMFLAAHREPLSVLESGLAEEFETEDGDGFDLELGSGLTESQLADLQAGLPGPIPADIAALLRRCGSFDFLPLETIDLTGRLSFEHTDLFPHGLPIAGDGYGNFWVVDVAEDGSWGPVFFACHDPPVAIVQAPNLASFFSEVLRLGHPDLPSRIHEVTGDYLDFIWRQNPHLLAVSEARKATNKELRGFAESLTDDFEIADLRQRAVGTGFSWGRAGRSTKLRRFGTELLFAVEKKKKKPLLRRLFGR